MNDQQIRPAMPEYALAFNSVRLAKSLCLWLILAMLVVQLIAFCLVRFVGVIDAVEMSAAEPTASVPAAQLSTRPASAPATAEGPGAGGPTARQGVGAAIFWKGFLGWVLRATKALAPIIGLLAAAAIILAVQLSLLGRLGGTAGLVSAWFWSLILLAVLSPWQNILREGFACGATYSLGELITQTRLVYPLWGAGEVSFAATASYYIRLLLLPLAAVGIWLAVWVKFARGERSMVIPGAGIAAAEAEGKSDETQL